MAVSGVTCLGVVPARGLGRRRLGPLATAAPGVFFGEGHGLMKDAADDDDFLARLVLAESMMGGPYRRSDQVYYPGKYRRVWIGVIWAAL